MTQTNRLVGPVLRTSMGRPETFIEEFPTPWKALIKAVCAYVRKECKVKNT